VFLGVHWSFDAFDVKVGADGITRTPDFTSPGSNLIGGVPLGLAIAEDIWANSTPRSVPNQGTVVVPKLGTRQTVQPYKVKAGDTLFNIAQAFNTTEDELLELNPYTFPNPELIFEGQNMMVPQVSSTPGSEAVVLGLEDPVLMVQ